MISDPFYTYIVRCADGTLYTGITNNPTKRLQQHNGKLKGGARYTASRRPVTYVYLESNKNRSDASKREAYLKRVGKSQKVKLIEQQTEDTLLHTSV